MTPSRAEARPQPRSHRDQTVGVVGAGGMAHTHLAAWQRLGVPAVVYSPSGRAAAFAPGYGASVAATVGELIESASVVDICSPTGTHRGLAELAAAAGRHVICEKPLALTHDDAAAIVAATSAAGVQLHVAHVVRYFDAYARARDLVLAGEVGTALTVRLRRTGAAPTAAWFHDENQSGGVLMDQMIHDFDYARWLLGNVATVSAHTERGTGTDGSSIVRATATLTHLSGSTSYLTGGWLEADAPWTTSLSVDGSAGRLRHTNARHTNSGETIGVSRNGARRRVELGRGPGGDLPYDAQLADFAAALAGGPDPRISPADAIAAVDLTLAANESARIGRPVSVTRPH